MEVSTPTPSFVFFSLTPEVNEECQAPLNDQETCSWMEDSECQENLFHIVALTPEETSIDENNHIHTTFTFFFEELGYLTEEPEPIDPTRDYDQEAKDLLNQRDRKVRQKHIDLIRIPSLEYNTRSGLSSSSSSIHHEQHLDVRSPHYMGHPLQSNSHKDHSHHSTYHYSAHLDPKHHHRSSKQH
ncbi:hypothetical protein K501DRAFT_287844 [Backusella circina FSU 941]|nr:hypothetical protein K501DRAFT_287844 [Backusella circina FSU 941]